MTSNQMAGELAAFLKSTAEFAEVKKLKTALDRNAQLTQKIKEFKNYEQALLSQGVPASDKRYLDLKKMFDELSKIPEVKRYLKAEQDFNSMLSRFYKIVGEYVDSELK